MMPANKLFLLLITCALLAFACTSSKRKAPTAPPIGGGDQSGDSSKELKELRDNLGTALSKVATLQTQVEQGVVSQADFDIAQQVIDDLKDKVSKGGASAQILKDLADLEKRVKDAEDQNKELKDQLASDSGDENHATEDKPNLTDQTEGGDAPVLHVSLVWVEEEKNENVTLIHKNGKEETQERSLARGTYVTFHSDKDVVVEEIKYGEVTVDSPVVRTSPVTPLPILLPVRVMFLHNSTELCASATLNLGQHLPRGIEEEDKKVQMNISREC